MESRPSRSLKGRGANVSPPCPFARWAVVWDEPAETVSDDEPQPRVLTEFFLDESKTIISENQSPDVGFRYSLNPYRGCEHGCPYCYARPLHEYLGWSAGLDFETKILVKERAAELFREWLRRPGWVCEPIAFSGATDCYQPAEKRFELTRACLQVALEARQPVTIVTKNALLLRDRDLLNELAARRLVQVSISMTTLDEKQCRQMEPRTSRPEARLRTLNALAEHDIPARVLVAPVIPGLNDSEMAAILKAAREAGARSASYTLLRLPPSVQPVFLEWLQRTFPTRSEKIESLIRQTHNGSLDDARFGYRMRGCGPLAEQIEQAFQVFRRRYGLDVPLPALDTSQFRPPEKASGQLRLF